MVEVEDCPKIDHEVEVSTTWGFPESIDPETVIFLGENDFALTLESDAKTKKAVLCKSLQQKASVYNTLGSVLNADCLAKIERCYPKPDYREILVHERGCSKRATQKAGLHSKQGSANNTKKSEKGAAGTCSQNKKVDSMSLSGDSKPSTSSPRSDVSSTKAAPKNLQVPKTATSSTPSSPIGSKRGPSPSPISPINKIAKQEPVDFPATTTYEDLGLTDHTGAYPCIYCSQTFMTMNELKAHCVELHKTNKPFKCKFCVKCFRNSRQLLLHTFTHTGEKHYKCLYCSQTFRQPGHRNNHMKINHGDSYPYKCNQDNCSAMFGTSLELSRHNKDNHIVRTTRCRACRVNFENHILYKQHQCPKKDRKLNCGACGEKFYRMADVLHHAKFCKYIDPSEVVCEKCGTKFPNAAKCSVHKTYLCTGEPVVQVKEEEEDKILGKVKEEMVDFDEVCDTSSYCEQSETSDVPQVINVDEEQS